jgi:lipopolysaccharide transport system ATP-binding protein
MAIVISVEDVSKAYRLGMIGGVTLKEDVARWWARMRGREDPLFKIGEEQHAQLIGEEFWALQHVGFEVEEGEVLGIIGRNGAGKSTLLKILSQVTAPTIGQINLRGRIASLLEVGTGFHPELSGRENIFLNGAILGMTKAEIRKNFDEIVEFSGVEQFLESPVKRYSSGMYVRLAFAVAAHLEAEILIVDEVLAVGDADFQKKCIGKMKDVSQRQGRTVLFVSHQIGMVSSLCSKAILLEAGTITASGNPSEVINKYFHSSGAAPHVIDYREGGRAPGDSLGRLVYACIEDGTGTPIEEIDIRRPFTVRMDFEILEDVPKGPHPNFHFFDSRGEYAFAVGGSNLVNGPARKGTYTSRCFVPGELLNNGPYSVGVALTFIHNGMHVSFYDRQGLSFTVVDPIDETLMDSRCGYAGPMPGPVRPNLRWETVKLS